MNDDCHTLLLVDDDEQLLSLYRHYLGDGYRVRSASSGTEALERFDDAVDLVLLDRRMPGTSGDELLAELRERGFDGPVTMVTAVDPDTDIVDMPFDDYLVKPVTQDELTDLVRTQLRRITYDETVRDYLAVASKFAVLEAEGTRAELDGDEEYQALRDRLVHLREASRSSLAEMADDEVDSLFRDLDAPAPGDAGDGDGAAGG